MKDYYKIMGVDKYATQDDIKKAYRSLAMKYHPDKHQAKSEAEQQIYEEKFKEINEAYEVLGSTQKRIDYDYECRKQEEKATAREEKRRNERVASHRAERTQSSSQSRSRSRGYSSRRYATNRKKSHTKSDEAIKDDGFFKSVKRAYQEVKAEEQPIGERHAHLNRKINSWFPHKTDSKIDLYAFRVVQGTVHVSSELIYQLSKLLTVHKDSVVKYVIRNRIPAVILSLYLMFSSAIPAINNRPSQTSENTVVAGENINQDDLLDNFVEDDTVTLTRKYTVEAGDSFAKLSDITSSPISTIKSINNHNGSSNMLWIGEEIELPYVINCDDLPYYTESVPSENLTIYDIADKYSTDAATIEMLNAEAIENINNVPIITSDTVLVPNFITPDELATEKANFDRARTY